MFQKKVFFLIFFVWLILFFSSIPAVYEKKDQKLKRLLEAIERKNDTVYMISFSKVNRKKFVFLFFETLEKRKSHNV